MSDKQNEIDSHVDPAADDADNGGSTSSSSMSSAPGSPVPQLFQSLIVEVRENQRWFPLIGWATSRLESDLPNFTKVIKRDAHHYGSPVTDSVTKFHLVLEERFPDKEESPVFILDKSVLPEGYEWSSFWSVRAKHPRGTDQDGWRYAKDFSSPRHFKKTVGTNTARYRVWERHVRVCVDGGDRTRPDAVGVEGPPAEAEDIRAYYYLLGKQKEMEEAERLKREHQQVVASGQEWTQELEIDAEKQLREFSKNLISSNLSNPFNLSLQESFHLSPTNQNTVDFGNEFRPSQSGAIAASSWARESQRPDDHDEPSSMHDYNNSPEARNRFEEEKLKYSFAANGEHSQFIDHQNDKPKAVDGLQTHSTVNRFVSVDREEDEEQEDQEGHAGSTTSNNKDDFDSIFQKFCQ